MSRSGWISGLPTYCSAPITDPDTYDLLRDACGSVHFTVTRELWDGIDAMIVGSATCNGCGASYLYTREATRDESATLAGAPHHLVLTAEIDWP